MPENFPRLLTDVEVGQLLRCSKAKVQRLRRAGAMPYLPGRPVLIMEKDVLEYIEGVKTKAALRAGPVPGSPEDREQRIRAAQDRARAVWLKRKLTEGRRGKKPTD